jgi:tryptophan-rich sensory protein
MIAPRQQTGFRFLPFIVSLLITLVIGITASVFTAPQIPGWYSTLHKPSFNPPSWLFAPVWTIIYIMIATAAYLVWQRREQTPLYRITTVVYSTQLLLNFSWSIIFFGLHQIFGALVVIILLWFVIIVNAICFAKISKAAGWLLLPYLLWVSFASVLNFSIFLLNR